VTKQPERTAPVRLVRMLLQIQLTPTINTKKEIIYTILFDAMFCESDGLYKPEKLLLAFGHSKVF
jgi:hypothetical protein